MGDFRAFHATFRMFGGPTLRELPFQVERMRLMQNALSVLNSLRTVFKKVALKSAVFALLLAIPIAASADAYKVQSVGDEAKGWAGRTVVATARPQARFMSYSRVKVAFGLMGIGAAAVQGRELLGINGVENPAPRLASNFPRPRATATALLSRRCA